MMRKPKPMWGVIDNRGTIYTSTIKATRRAAIAEWMRQVRPGAEIKAARKWAWWRRNGYVCPRITIQTKGAVSVPNDVRRLVIAARLVAFGDMPPSRKAIKELDAASEAFAARVPWDDEPKRAKGARHDKG